MLVGSRNKKPLSAVDVHQSAAEMADDVSSAMTVPAVMSCDDNLLSAVDVHQSAAPAVMSCDDNLLSAMDVHQSAAEMADDVSSALSVPAVDGKSVRGEVDSLIAVCDSGVHDEVESSGLLVAGDDPVRDDPLQLVLLPTELQVCIFLCFFVSDLYIWLLVTL